MKRFLFFVLSVFFLSMELCGAEEDLLIRPSDIRLVAEDPAGFGSNGGYHLYIRKKPGINSVMLTETTKDPEGQDANYAYRAPDWNPVNGDEVRYLDGKMLNSQWSRYSLIDSTAEPDPVFGESFHIYIPPVMLYGYPWTRHGSVRIHKGTFVNIRAFSELYGDYTGHYFDNPFMFDLRAPVKKPAPAPAAEPVVVVKEPEPQLPPSPVIPQPEEPVVEEPEPPVEKPVEEPAPEPVEEKPAEEPAIEEPEVPILTDDYNPVAAAKFQELSEMMYYSKGPETLVDDIMRIINSIEPKETADIVFAIDATGSMQDDVDQLRKEWIPRLVTDLKQFKHVRLGLLLYRDYVDNWRYKGIPVKYFGFTDDLNQFLENLNGFTIKGIEGGDIPEAVYEAMYGALAFYDWDAEAARRIILIGDAEPHPRPRGTGKYTKEFVTNLSKEKDIPVTAIILPDDKAKRGR